MAHNSLVTLRPMTAADIPVGMQLKSIAGWNQSTRDWTMILNESQGGCFCAVKEDTVVGTITTVTYGNRFNWLGMLLVAPEYRRQGIGTMLLNSAIDFARAKGAIYLDARPAGEPLYRSLGFKEICTLYRMERPGNPHMDVPPIAQPLNEPDTFKTVCVYDKPIFGADRCGILTCIYHDAPHYGYVIAGNAHEDGNISGYCLGRSGAIFEQLGPIVADTGEDAQALLLTALKHCAHKSVIVDIPAAHSQWMGWLEKQGFVKRNAFTRMVLGSQGDFGLPQKQFAIAGPEIG